MRVIRFADLKEVPWKNGGGITRTIAVGPNPDAPLWRVSMADVDGDGPFSSFEGLTRVLTVIRGRGMILRGLQGDMRADHGQPVVFDGAAPVTAYLDDGPLRDLNLMFDTQRCSGSVTAQHGPQRLPIGTARHTVLVHCFAGQAQAGKLVIGLGDTALCETPVQLTLGAGDSVLCISVGPRAQTEASKSPTASL